jgi:hypothetical protein
LIEIAAYDLLKLDRCENLRLKAGKYSLPGFMDQVIAALQKTKDGYETCLLIIIVVVVGGTSLTLFCCVGLAGGK